MRTNGTRTKKLIVAFHFQYANQAAWKCETCRKGGLATQRNCGWLPKSAALPERVIWARGGVGLTDCPVSHITAESTSLLEEFHVWKLFGCSDFYNLPARSVEAICVLENELRMEYAHAQN